jgi:cytochrome d ubiquinol oxidase subunit II
MPIEMLVLATIGVGMTLYAVLGGADFGAGVWEFNTALQASEKERALIYRAIGPVWEANHVWLIFVIVAMFSAFPAAFAALCRGLWLPLLLALVGIVFRGAAYAFRSHAVAAARQQAVWGAVFALASTAAPFFLGAAMGAVAAGKLPVTAEGDFTGNYLTGWMTPLAIFNGFFTVGMCAYVAAVFLAREAFVEGSADLTVLWRRRALGVGVWMGILALVGLAFVAVDAPLLWNGFRERAWWLVAASVVAGFASLAALWRGFFRTAGIGVATTVATVIWGWAFAQSPWLVPPAISIESAKAEDGVLRLVAWSIAGGMLLLLPALAYLFYLFKTDAPRPG